MKTGKHYFPPLVNWSVVENNVSGFHGQCLNARCCLLLVVGVVAVVVVVAGCMLLVVAVVVVCCCCCYYYFYHHPSPDPTTIANE